MNKKILALALVFVLVTAPIATATTLEWSVSAAQSVDMETDGSGDFLYYTDFSDNLVKIDQSDGSTVWTESLADRGEDIHYQEASNIILVSIGDSIVAFNTDGSERWTFTGNFSTAIAATHNPDTGRIFATGYDSAGDMWLYKLDTGGNILGNIENTTGNARDIAFNREEDQIAVGIAATTRPTVMYDTDLNQLYVYDNTTDEGSVSDVISAGGNWYISYSGSDIHTVDSSGNTIAITEFQNNDIERTQNDTIVLGSAANGLFELDQDLNTVTEYTTDGFRQVTSDVKGTQLWTYGFNNDISENQAYTGGTVPDPNLETNLELEIDSWMPLNSSQSYTVYLNQTNTSSGNVNLTDVTENATVESSNTTVITVDNASDTLNSHGAVGISGINASFNGEKSNTTNVTAGPRNLDNIGIMPPEQWPCSFLECDYGDGDELNLGSPMQWILFIIVVTVFASRMFQNPWIGHGSALMTAILLWVLDFIPLGIVLSATFYVILAGVILAGSGSVRIGQSSGSSGSSSSGGGKTP